MCESETRRKRSSTLFEHFMDMHHKPLLCHALSVCDRYTYLVVFETAVAPAFVVVEVLGFGAVDDVGLLVVAI